jgi:DNA-nicking Smr family endonuclease
MGTKSRKTDEFSVRPFEKLKKQIKHHEASAPPPALAVPDEPKPPSEEELFTAAMSDVQMIREFRVLRCANAPRHEAPSRQKQDPDSEALDILEQIARGNLPINLSDTQEYVEWTNPDFQDQFTEKLHTGHFSIQGLLDLHGYTGDEVNEEVDVFLGEAFRKGWRCVKIIHGRGLRSVKGPVLKDAVIRRLSGRYRKQVIAFVSARQCDGGLGALYVLLGKR